MNPAIDPNRVDAIFRDCLFNEGEDTTHHVPVEGIVHRTGFHPDRLESHREEIVAMLQSLPREFQQLGGGGWSFLNACNDVNGEQWTGLHQRMDQLFQLGLGIGRVMCLMPKDLWSALPGGMPYYVVLSESQPSPIPQPKPTDADPLFKFDLLKETEQGGKPTA